MSKKTDPKVAESVMLKAGYKPLEIYQSAHAKWKCLHIPCGEIVHPTYNTIQQGFGGCLTCQHRKSADRQRMSQKTAISIMQKAELEPLENYKNMNSPWKCKCLRCGTIVSPRLSGIVSGQGGCLSCGFKKSGLKSRKDENIAIKIMLDANLEPLEPYVNSHKPWKCKCLKCEAIITPTLSGIQSASGGCKYCARNYIDSETAIERMILKGYQPQEPYISSGTKWKCIHIPCGKVVFPLYANIQNGKGGCMDCGSKQSANATRTSEKTAIEKMLIAQLEPLVPYTNNHTPWKSKCLKCGAIVSPSLKTVLKGSGCINCTPFGINMVNPSYLYLITHQELGSHKVGIGNHKKKNDRLGRFRQFGWETHKVWEIESGREALRIEKAVFKILRKELKLPIFLSYDDMPKTQGHSETVDAEAISLLQLEKIINKAIKGQQK
jgi:hypothetical protein